MGALFAAMNGWLGAPLGGELANGLVGGFIKAKQIANYKFVQQGAGFIAVGKVSGQEVLVFELVKDGFGVLYLRWGQGPKV